VTGEAGIALRLHAAERAIGTGAALEAQRWCESASALDANDATAALLMGRALVQLGDLVAAGVSLARAATLTSDPELSARISAELGDLAFLRGALADASSLAERTVSGATTVPTRLLGRNTLGKVLLAQTRWDDADAHFASDALEAASHGETTAELRARLNRAIAVLSKGLLDDARAMLERILDDASRAGEDRAAAHAHSNLGVIAYRQHDYAAALAHWEATTRFPQALRGRMATAITVANLAELRLRLGLVDHAEHALVFGRRLISAGAAPARVAHYRRVAAQIALARRATDVARREVDAALVDAEASGDKDVLQAVLAAAARIALEDGDLTRAVKIIARAAELATHDRARAEASILRALHLRALGQSALDAATDALSFARAAGDEDLLSEIHALLAVVHRDGGDRASAHAHCARAISVRDQMAASLPADIRSAYLAKPEIMALARLQAALASADDEDEAPRTARVPFSAPSSPSISAARDAQSSGAREIVGDDPQIKALMLAIRKVARASSTVLIRGESGTGKELVAEALHAASDRASGPLVSVNCAALVETLLLSELFGHEKGAFTGAASRRRGRFEMAEGGTLFLDEIGDISARTQVALLRVLQEKTFERVGGVNPIRANVRVICATHRDLKAMVERGDFREDLYYRLRGITLEVPALRQRIGDLPKLADHLLHRIAEERGERAKTLSPEATDLLVRHRWPGNIRELENVLRGVSLFAEGDAITDVDLIDNVDDLRALAQGPLSQAPVSLRSIIPPPPSMSHIELPDDDEGGGALPDGEASATQVAYAQVRQGAVSLADMKRQIERDCIARALSETKGNITKAAALLGMKRPRLSQLVKQYGLSATSEGSQ
jgi:transcriptional regulator with GAF, ATPase, and Fis domain